MSEQQSGLSIFDAAKKSAEVSFPPARRGGYDSDAVDAWARAQSAELQKAAETVKALQADNDELHDLVDQLRERVESVDRPSYSGLGGHAAQLLQLAEQEADDVRVRARREAEELLKNAESESALLRPKTPKPH